MQDQTERRASYVKPAAALQDSVVTLVRNSVSIFPEHHEPLTTPTALLDIWKPEVINKLAHALFKCEWTPLQQELDSKGNFDKNAFHIQMIENLCLQHEHLHLKPLQHKLGRIMYEYYRHASLECTLPPDLHKRLVERFTESQSKPPNNLTVLYRCPRDQWGPALDTIAYYTMFERSPESTRAEHIIEEMSQELDNMARDEDSEELSPRIMQQMPQLIQAAQEEERPSFHETNLNRHWVSVRVKFEYVYRHYFGGYEQHHQVPFMVRREASHIFRHLVHLCIDFREFEYGWYWFERSFLKQDWNALLGVSELCKAASDHDSLWNARMWAVYATVIQMGHKQIAGSPDYPQFMYNFAVIVRNTSSSKDALGSLTKLVRDMLQHTNTRYFPFSVEFLDLLVELVWKERESNTKQWKEAFDSVFSIYSNYKQGKQHLKTGTIFKPEAYLVLMKVCTITGHKQEFFLLNKDMPLDKEFAQHVRTGYLRFVQGHEPTETKEDLLTVLEPVIADAMKQILF